MSYLMVLCDVFSDFLYKSICCGYSFELHGQIYAIQMGTHNICLYKEEDKKVKNTELLDCLLIGVCALIRSNTLRSTVIWKLNVHIVLPKKAS